MAPVRTVLAIAIAVRSAFGLVVDPRALAYAQYARPAAVAQASQPTPPPDLSRRHVENVFERAQTTTLNTCGWTTADAYEPATCPIGQNCGWWSNPDDGPPGHAVCCPLDEDGALNWGGCPGPTTCRDYSDYAHDASSTHGLWALGVELSATWNSTVYW